MIRQQPCPPLFPSTTLFRSKPGASRYSPEFVQRYREAQVARVSRLDDRARALITRRMNARARSTRSEEHTSELQSYVNLVCRLLLEKKKSDVFAFLAIFISC